MSARRPTTSPAIPLFIDKKARKAVALTGFKKVLKKGLEPLWLAPYEPESYVSTNFTT